MGSLYVLTVTALLSSVPCICRSGAAIFAMTSLVLVAFAAKRTCNWLRIHWSLNQFPRTDMYGAVLPTAACPGPQSATSQPLQVPLQVQSNISASILGQVSICMCKYACMTEAGSCETESLQLLKGTDSRRYCQVDSRNGPSAGRAYAGGFWVVASEVPGDCCKREPCERHWLLLLSSTLGSGWHISDAKHTPSPMTAEVQQVPGHMHPVMCHTRPCHACLHMPVTHAAYMCNHSGQHQP